MEGQCEMDLLGHEDEAVRSHTSDANGDVGAPYHHNISQRSPALNSVLTERST